MLEKKNDMKNIFLIIYISISFCGSATKEYKKIYDNNGTLVAEGWMRNGEKVKFWKFYHPNGVLAKEGHFKDGKPAKYWYFYRENSTKLSEGHYIDGKKCKWWLFYDEHENVDHKCQLKNDQKNGYCLRYKNEQLVRAEKYKNGKKIGEWTDLKSFKKENSVWDLQ